MTFAVGSLVKVRDREWVVLPTAQPDWLVLRPLGGTDREVTGIYLPLEQDQIEPARFALPDPEQSGDFSAGRLLRDAVRLGFRTSAGPFRSFARLNVEPRPYQLVPLLLALKQDPVRLLIADDVGIGKTIEAGLIARELLDRGEVERLAVLCPPQLAEQWQAELRDKFNIEAVLVLPSTVPRLERDTSLGQALFDLHPVVIVSTEYIKSSRRRDEFIRTCPPLVIVDEAHTCAFAAEQRGGRHLRHELVKDLARAENRHLILVTATPHSGNEEAFRSLLGLLKPDFMDLPLDLSGKANEPHRRAVAQHLVQRRRADVRAYLDAPTDFPTREEAEESYTLSNEYKKLFNTVLNYARERITAPSSSMHQQRVRWWSALALLRSMASSPAAAAATLRSRSATASTDTADEADTIGERAVLDLGDTDTAEFLDINPGSHDDTDDTQPRSERERLLRLARRAEALFGPQNDTKLKVAAERVKQLLAEGYQPIVFCRFIDTADYLAQQLRQLLDGVEVMAVTSQLPPALREQRVRELAASPQRVLVATDCLSEGINLQEGFNAVFHYDLSWNPTRHEQREGRVDRYGQASPTVRTLTFYGLDNQIDGLVLDVLLRKHRAIRSSLGISVPVPGNTSELIQALMQGVLLRDSSASGQQLSLFDTRADLYENLHLQWDNATAREKQSRTLFAQQGLNVSEVSQEWQAVQQAIGTGVDVQRFIEDAISTHGGSVNRQDATVTLRLPPHTALREAGGLDEVDTLAVRFTLPTPANVTYLHRTHPIVAGLASYVMDTALDPLHDSKARRSGAIRTSDVSVLTTLLLLRLRYHLLTRRGDTETPLLTEDSHLVGFTGTPAKATWLPPEEAEALLAARPTASVPVQQGRNAIRRVIQGFSQLEPALNDLATQRGAEILAAHQRVRTAARQRGIRYEVHPHLPPDVLGIYILLPEIG